MRTGALGKRFCVSAAFFAAFMVASAAFAAGKVHHESPFGMSFVYSVINFVILVLALYFLLRKPTAEFFRKRATNTRLEMDKARKYYEDAQRQHAEIDGKILKADAEARQLLESLRREGEAEKLAVLKQAREMSEKIREDTGRIIEQEIKKACEILKAETVAIAAELATKTLEARLSIDEQNRLADEFVTELQVLKKA